jgi:integrase
MPKLAYNDRAVRSSQPVDGKRTKYSIIGHPGLVLIVTPGSPEPSRRWFVRYQVGRGDDRRQGYDAIGDIKHWSVGQAWETATKIIRSAQGGVDPKAERQAANESQAQNARTVSVVYDEWLKHPGRSKTLRQRSMEAYDQQFKHLESRIGAVPIGALTGGNIRAALEEIRVATTDPEKGHRGYIATKCLKLIRSLCRFSTEKGYLDRDPTRGIDPPVPESNPDGRQHRPPSDAELRRLWNAAPEHMSAQHVRIMKLALLLGKRVSEICGALKTEVMLEGERPSWFIPGTREGNKSREDQVVPLPPLAAAILREQIKDAHTSPFLFPARHKPQIPTMRHAPSQAFSELRDALGIDSAVRFHDSRGLISDQMAKLGVPAEYRSHVLHHTGDTRASLANSVYSTYDFEPQKRRALELWERRLLEIVEERPPSGERW